MPNSADPLHSIVVTEGKKGRKYGCTRCHTAKKGRLCEKAAQRYHALQLYFKRRKNRPERWTKKHPNYDIARRLAPFSKLRYLRLLVEAYKYPEKIDPTSEYWTGAQYEKAKHGRPPTDPRDLIMALLIYAGLPELSFTEVYPLILQAHYDGFIKNKPCLNWPSRACQQPAMKQILEELITDSVKPFVNRITSISMDGTGQRLGRSHQYKQDAWGKRKNRKTTNPLERCIQPHHLDTYLQEIRVRLYEGLHATICTKLKVFVSGTVGPGKRHDSKFFHRLMELVFRAGVRVEWFFADAAYGSEEIRNFLADRGIKVFIPFKQNETRGDTRSKSKAWREQWDYFFDYFHEYMIEFGKRSLSESMFAALKEKFGEKLRMKSHQTRWNEALARLLTYNAGRVIQLMHERNMDHAAFDEHPKPGIVIPRKPRASNQQSLKQFL